MDPRLLNCASGACCPAGSTEQLNSTVKILCHCGCPEEHAGALAKNLIAAGAVLFSGALASAIGDFVLDRSA